LCVPLRGVSLLLPSSLPLRPSFSCLPSSSLTFRRLPPGGLRADHLQILMYLALCIMGRRGVKALYQQGRGSGPICTLVFDGRETRPSAVTGHAVVQTVREGARPARVRMRCGSRERYGARPTTGGAVCGRALSSVSPPAYGVDVMCGGVEAQGVEVPRSRAHKRGQWSSGV
jgi:hypothetical protein